MLNFIKRGVPDGTLVVFHVLYRSAEEASAKKRHLSAKTCTFLNRHLAFVFIFSLNRWCEAFGPVWRPSANCCYLSPTNHSFLFFLPLCHWLKTPGVLIRNSRFRYFSPLLLKSASKWTWESFRFRVVKLHRKCIQHHLRVNHTRKKTQTYLFFSLDFPILCAENVNELLAPSAAFFLQEGALCAQRYIRHLKWHFTLF